MGCRFSNVWMGIHDALAPVALTVALAIAPGAAALAQSDESGSDNALVGVWVVEVTLRNCDTRAPLGPPFQSLVTFHRGGTVMDTPAGLAFAPGQRTPGHGTWSQQPGQTYVQQMIALILFDTTPNFPVSHGFFAGWQTITHTVELINRGQLVSAGTNAFFRSDGTLYRTGCSTAVGRRFK